MAACTSRSSRCIDVGIQFICVAFICLWTGGEVTEAQVTRIVRVQEGIHVYPKVITTFQLYQNLENCTIDSVGFTSPNGIRQPNKPKLFGLQPTPVQETTTATARTVAQNTTFKLLDFYASTSAGKAFAATSGNLNTTVKPASHSEAPFVSSEAPNATTNSTHFRSTVTPGTAFTLTTNMSTATSAPTTHVTNHTSSGPFTATTGQGTTPSIIPFPPIHFHSADVVQLNDLDRERADKHFITVHCGDGFYGFGDLFEVEVEDINDNTPIFDKSSLVSTVLLGLNFGDAVLLIKATDADVGLNAKLKFGISRGSERVIYKNTTEVVHPSDYIFSVLPSGFVILLSSFDQEVTATFKVVVKDRGDRNDGNRATATATVSFVDSLPAPPTTAAPTTSAVTSASAAGDHVSWWIIAVPCIVGAVVILAVLAIVYFKYMRRKQLCRRLLVIDDENISGDNDQLIGAMGRLGETDSRADHVGSRIEPRIRSNSDLSDDDVLPIS